MRVIPPPSKPSKDYTIHVLVACLLAFLAFGWFVDTVRSYTVPACPVPVQVTRHR
jgi:hypothetical protein